MILIGVSVLVLVAEVFACLTLFFAARRLHSPDRGATKRQVQGWTLMSLGYFFSSFGDLVWWIDHFHTSNATYLLANCAYVSFYLCFLIGIFLAPKGRRSILDLTKTVIDITLILATLGLILLIGVISPLLTVGLIPEPIISVNIFFPVGDLIAVVALNSLFACSPREKNRLSLQYLNVAMIFNLIGDVAYTYGFGLRWIQQYDVIVSSIFILANLLVGIAGIAEINDLHLQKKKYTYYPDIERRLQVNSKRQVVLPFLSIFLSYGVLSYMLIANETHQRTEALGMAGLIVFFAFLRQFVLFYENNSLSQHLQKVLLRLRLQSDQLTQTNHEMAKEIIERSRAEDRLRFEALHDSLTRLPNRVLFTTRLKQAEECKRNNPFYNYAVLFLDLDGFKMVNDSLGHTTGDRLLVHTADILLKNTRANDMVARLGGDEFVILLDDVRDQGEVEQTAHRLTSQVSEPTVLENTRVFITISVGIVVCDTNNFSPEEILSDADLAMYQAKERGKSRFEIFHPEMRERALRRMEIENALHNALEHNEFNLVYQPILSLKTQQIQAFEALIRWQHPKHGVLLPSEFIPIAEETGIIIPLGFWVVQEACRKAQELRSTLPELPSFKMNVNISGIQLNQSDFIERIQEILEETGLPGNYLALEMTESICMENMDRAIQILKQLDAMGVESQIDDFGTGYSSLNYLRRLPVNSIKIDRSFIREICEDPKGSVPDITRAIFSMVHDLGLRTIAEGIEDPVQLSALRNLRCDSVQGNYLAAPMPWSQLKPWVVENRTGVQNINFFPEKLW